MTDNRNVSTAKRVERIGDATLYLGDCREILPTLSGFDAVVTDPPYGVGKAVWDDWAPDELVWRMVADAMCEGASLLIFPGEACAPLKIAQLSAVFSYQWVIPWYKPNAMQFGKTGFSKHNLIWWFAKGKPSAKPDMIDVIVAPMCAYDDRDIGHPSPKPIAVIKPLISNFSAPGGIILDPFMGSGTSGVACFSNGRKFVGIEVHEPYFDIACRRIEQAQRQPDLFVPRQASTPHPTLALEDAP